MLAGLGHMCYDDRSAGFAFWDLCKSDCLGDLINVLFFCTPFQNLPVGLDMRVITVSVLEAFAIVLHELLAIIASPGSGSSVGTRLIVACY